MPRPKKRIENPDIQITLLISPGTREKKWRKNQSGR
jgi:hypothetical protein